MGVNICWNITNKCNESCRYCFRDKTSEPLNTADAISILRLLPGLGVSSITFSGGEPLLYDGIIEVIEYSKSLGLQTSLMTNSLLLTDALLLRLEGCLDWLSFSLDSMDCLVQEKMGRNPAICVNINKVLEKILHHNLSYSIKINTVLCKINADQLMKVYNWVNANIFIKRWKVMQFTSLRGDSLKNSSEFEISEVEFDSIRMGMFYPKRDDLSIGFDDCSSIKSSYLVISPDGCIRRWSPEYQREILVGEMSQLNNTDVFETFNVDFNEYSARRNHITEGVL